MLIRPVLVRAVLVVLAGCGVIAASGCSSGTGGSGTGDRGGAPAGGHEPPAGVLASSMQASVRHARSVHVAGSLSSGGVPIGLDVSVYRNGDVSGTVRPDGSPYQILGIGGLVYVKATPQFLAQIGAPSTACAIACGRWLRLSAADARQLSSDLSMTTLIAPLTAQRLPGLAEAGSTTVGGQAAWVLRVAGGSQVDVGMTSGHYPVGASTANPQSVVTYTKWNALPPPAPPPAGGVVDMGQLP